MHYALGESTLSRAACEALDAAEPLAKHRASFVLPEDVIYLGGISLGPLPRNVPERVRQLLEEDWGQGLVGSWATAGWMEAAARVGGKLAPLLGASADEVIVADSTSVNLFKLLVAARRLRPNRDVLLSETDNFPTDLHVAQGVRDLLGDVELKLVATDDIERALDESVAVLFLTHVDFKTSRMHDLARLTRLAHEAGALVLWDLSHSVAAMPLDLAGCEADLAVGCGYKFLCGGAGAPAFLFVAQRHQASLAQPITGWIGHARPMDFGPTFEPASGIARMLTGTPPILALAALEASLDVWSEVDLNLVRAKSVALGELLIRLVDQRGGMGLRLASPADGEQRGSHVAYHHPRAGELMQTLNARGVLADVRPGNLMRFGLTPLTLRFVDVWNSLDVLAQILKTHQGR